jgi:predicted lipoprotein
LKKYKWRSQKSLEEINPEYTNIKTLIMKAEHKHTLLELAESLINVELDEIKKEISKIKPNLSTEEINLIFETTDNKILELNRKLEQLRKLYKND